MRPERAETPARWSPKVRRVGHGDSAGRDLWARERAKVGLDPATKRGTRPERRPGPGLPSSGRGTREDGGADRTAHLFNTHRGGGAWGRSSRKTRKTRPNTAHRVGTEGIVVSRREDVHKRPVGALTASRRCGGAGRMLSMTI